MHLPNPEIDLSSPQWALAPVDGPALLEIYIQSLKRNSHAYMPTNPISLRIFLTSVHCFYT
jgi:hypothetical protein